LWRGFCSEGALSVYAVCSRLSIEPCVLSERIDSSQSVALVQLSIRTQQAILCPRRTAIDSGRTRGHASYTCILVVATSRYEFLLEIHRVPHTTAVRPKRFRPKEINIKQTKTSALCRHTVRPSPPSCTLHCATLTIILPF